MTKLKLPAFLLFLIIISACRRDAPTSWDIHGKVPFLKGDLGWGDIDSDSIFQQDGSGLLHLIYSDRLASFDLDTLVDIPDTAITNGFSPPFSGGPFMIPPGSEVISIDENIGLDLEQVGLREVRIASGTLTYTLKSFVNGALDVEYILPGVILPAGSSIELNVETSAGSADVPWVYTNDIDMAGVSIDLQGSTGSMVNRIASALTVSASANNVEPVPVMGDDSVTVELSFTDLKVAYAKGYFGQLTTEIDEEVNLYALTGAEGQLLLEEIRFELRLVNKMGADMKLTLDDVSANYNGTPIAQSLTHPILHQSVNLTRATDLSGEVLPQEYAVVIDQDNSNILTLFNELPNFLSINGELELNPLGDVSGGNDFIYTDAPFEAEWSVDMPLCIGSSGLSLRDTIEMAAFDAEWTADAKLILEFTNHFPLAIDHMEGWFITPEGIQTDLFSGFSVSAGQYVSQGYIVAGESSSEIAISRDQLASVLQGGQLVLLVRFASYDGQIVKFTGGETLGVSGVLDGVLEISYE